MTDEQIKALDDCVRAVQRQLAECATTKAIDPADGDLSDPAWCLAVEATCLCAYLSELRGKRAVKVRYA